jgi:hypothetical protein
MSSAVSRPLDWRFVQRISPVNRDNREQAYEADLSKHRETLDQLSEARESKIAALGKDVVSLRGTVSKLESNLTKFYETPNKQNVVPLISRSSLSELQNQAVRINLPEKVPELEGLRIELAREHKAPVRTDDEAATLVAQVNVARADLLGRSARLDNFEASEHLTQYEMRALESSAELLRDHELLREVHEWERKTSRSDSSIDLHGRAVARGIMSGIAAEETKERLQRFLDSARVASLNLGHHRTGTLREVEARTLTDYLARAIESSGARDYRRLVKAAAHEQHGRLVKDFDKAMNYHEATREMAAEAQGREPQFTDKEKRFTLKGKMIPLTGRDFFNSLSVKPTVKNKMSRLLDLAKGC